MSSIKLILALIKKDLLLEARQQYSFYGVLLYIASTTFVVYLTMGQPEDKVWNGLFWVLQLFVCINAVAKSFLQENRGRMLYYYSIASPTHFVLSKLLFNAILMLFMNILSLGVFTLLLGNPVIRMGEFMLISILGGISLSLVFTFLAAIAAKAQQQAAMMAIMGFPIIIPQLLLLTKVSAAAFTSAIQNGWWQMVGLLGALDIMVIALAIILFPFLWKD
ncbi:MAG TPA: heme exporter protein CcmB [Sediminibacterium sp.]|uniref:heme exporter protein CcmB n=1 Tax=Sediminibacterium sp. TaxID=1917865 RepID=UPI0008CB1BD9|nr:heme exporter protein CcmB [Sediminibacterium sp.]OHC85696.1 MAG: cytochrome C biogenesis protein [Sphingobacteriia bacterium RIFOXYC2_FULL_35_18]OHC87232.1 MAG: cytochrome C biogenesis protein [Sphingobacteriia bacterium RIFOXYD2_FULL_35_12]HLD52662.1 heme exporter protein CcmB [Sediminibacterium sp.]